MNLELETPPTGPGILYSYYARRHVAVEQCVAMHGLTYLVAGSLQVSQAASSQVFGTGSLLFSRRNFLAKFTKLPATNGPFQAITVVFDQPLLRAFRQSAGLGSGLPAGPSPAVQAVPLTSALQHLYTSLWSSVDESLSPTLTRERQQQALGLLVHAQPALQAVLFEFGQPGKVDLETFMRHNFRFNLAGKQLAYLTGRSLAAFKRDFKQLFHTSPTRWLYQQRLAEAYYLLQQENWRPSEVYQEVGFESLAHFSHAFKQLFGYPPSRVRPTTRAR
jgi:AraC-like DNA-binding protein